MALHPSVYAELLKKKIQQHQVDCWLVNTGWIGGPYGVGHRISIKYTRALLNAALDGKLAKVDFITDPVLASNPDFLRRRTVRNFKPDELLGQQGRIYGKI